MFVSRVLEILSLDTKLIKFINAAYSEAMLQILMQSCSVGGIRTS